MNRTDGLVQRKNVNQPFASTEDHEEDDEATRLNSQESEERDDLDSKETRLTLMEEVLLLGLKDREVILITKRIYSSMSFC